MSWLYSQALVAEYLEGTCSDGAPFAPSSGNPTPQAYLPPDKMTAFSRPSRFGMTFAPLTDDRGEELLTWFREGFRARTSAQPEKVPGSTASEAGFGEKWRELSVRYDPDTSSWRTHRCLWDEDLSACSLTLPKWGLMRDGVLLERMTLALPTAANDAGLWPTPKANDAEKRGNFDVTNPRNGLPAAVKKFATPQARDFRSGQAARWDDPRRTRNLNDQIAKWPTPVASMSKGSSPNALTRKDGQDRSNDRLDHAVMASDGGQLNPTWVEWLMGWPLGWTDLKPLETDRCRNAQRRHGGF